MERTVREKSNRLELSIMPPMYGDAVVKPITLSANLKMKKILLFFHWWNAEEAKDNQMKLYSKIPSFLSSGSI